MLEGAPASPFPFLLLVLELEMLLPAFIVRITNLVPILVKSNCRSQRRFAIGPDSGAWRVREGMAPNGDGESVSCVATEEGREDVLCVQRLYFDGVGDY